MPRGSPPHMKTTHSQILGPWPQNNKKQIAKFIEADITQKTKVPRPLAPYPVSNTICAPPE